MRIPAIPVFILIFLCQHKGQMHTTFHLKTYRGGTTAATTTDGIKHRQIGIHSRSESIPMAIVNVLTVIQHRSSGERFGIRMTSHHSLGERFGIRMTSPNGERYQQKVRNYNASYLHRRNRLQIIVD
jgi:hypothetical protein